MKYFADPPTILLPAWLFAILMTAGCSNDASPYSEANDPAMQQYTTEPTSAHASTDTPSDAMPDTDPKDDPKTDAPPPAHEKVELTDEQWRSILSEQEFYVLRRSGTELPGTGRYNDHDKKDKGAFHCVGCGNKLYDAKHKFHSGCGWPSFNQEVEKGALTIRQDRDGYRVEMLCARCDGHLGHIFNDGNLWDQETGLRHCVNGTALIFIPEGADPQDVIRKHRETHAGK